MKFLKSLSIIVTIIIYSVNANANINNVIAAYNKGNLEDAIHLSHGYKDVHSFLLSQKYLTKTDKSSFEEITAFLNAHKNFPQFNNLATIAESRITNSTSKIKIIKWFDHHKPITANGHYQYYLAAIKQVKNHDKLNFIIKTSWINGAFTKQQADEFLSKHKQVLTQYDHVDKINELLWKGKTEEAKQYFPLVDKNYQQVFTAWISLLKKGGKNPEQAFHKIKGSYKYHSGLLYSYLKLHIKTPPNSELIGLYLKAPKDETHAKEWWKLKNYFARELFELENYSEAYKIVRNHNLKEPCDKCEAEWFAGWIAISYLKKPADGAKHFENIYTSSKSSISKSRGAYWLARSYKALNQKDLADKWYKTAANLGFTFYGQLAQAELGYKNLILPAKVQVTNEDKIHYKSNNFAQIIEFLAKTNRHELLKLYAKQAFYSAKSAGEVAMIYERISPHLNLNTKVEIAKLAQHAGVLLLDASYPSPYKAAKNSRDPALTFSIIRQETVFDQFGVSEDNAQGLMQIMPSTAKNLCQKLNIKYDFKKLTSNPDYNIKLGTYYLDKVMEEYNNSYVMMSANYNAGPVVNKWEEKFGKRSGMKLYEAIDWIESIPFYETRNYVQRIIENIQVYRYVLTGDKRLKVKDDVTR